MYTDADFEWDNEKNLDNQDKHGITFEEAKLIWDGYVAVYQDKGHYKEVRWIAVGFLDSRTILFVVYTMRGERKRIISARKAEPYEAQRFHDKLRSRRRRG